MYRSVSSNIRLPVSVLTLECRDILDQFWPLKLQNKDSGMELVQGRMSAIEPNYTSGRGQCETKFPVYGNNSVTMYRPLVHLRGERKTTEVL